MPPKKQQLPFNFSGWTKNNVDFPTPITNIKPEIIERMSSVSDIKTEFKHCVDDCQPAEK